MSVIRLIFIVLLLVSLVIFLAVQGLSWFFSAHDRPLEGVRLVGTETAPGKFLVGYEKGPENAEITLLFIHGTPGSSSAFREQMNGDFPDWRLVALDRPGFGASKGDRADACLSAQSEAVDQFIKDHPYQKVILVGHSYGAPVAVATALRNTRVIGVVLMGGCLNPAEEKPWPIQYVGDWPWVSWAMPKELRQCNVELLRLKVDLIDLDQHLSRLSCPLIMLHGDLDDLVPVGNVAYMKNRMVELNKASLFSSQIYPGWDHFIPWQHPVEINRRIKQFVEGLPK